MLLNFRFKNFRSFYDEQELSMMATNIKEHNQYIIEKDGFKVLPTAIIYGPNASGKTSIKIALDMLKNIIIEGTIEEKNKNLFIDYLELVPFIHEKDKHDEPIELKIEVTIGNIVFSYEISIKVNIERMRDMCDRCIVYEKFAFNDIVLYERNENSVKFNKSEEVIGIYNGLNEKNQKIGIDNLVNAEENINLNLDKKSLILTISFKSSVCSKIADVFIFWIKNNLRVYGSFKEIDYSPNYIQFENNNSDTLFVANKFWNDYLKKGADFGPQDIFIELDKKNQNKNAYSKYNIKGLENSDFLFPSILMESNGTLNLHKFADVILDIMVNGGTIFIDEIDSSLHPEIIASIIRVFNDLDINKSNAQLIMTSHNPILLEYFRRDQIYFVQKDKETYKSELYSLYDFKNEDGERVRKDAVYMRNYIKGLYGAIPDVDFASAVKQLLEELGKNS